MSEVFWKLGLNGNMCALPSCADVEAGIFGLTDIKEENRDRTCSGSVPVPPLRPFEKLDAGM